MKSLLGKKLGMTQIFDQATGRLSPVTVIQVGPCPVVQVKSEETDGYNAVQLGFGDARPSTTTLPMRGHFKKAGVMPRKLLREFRLDAKPEVEVGQELTVELLEGVAKVSVTGVTKGRGFQGGVKRHGFSTGPKTHGSRNYRAPGSIGQCATPARVFKGRRMPGQYGNVRMTTRNLKVQQIDVENNLLLVGGAVPGARNGYVIVRVAE
jgi:large subunit ribosomal protein L3